MNGTTTDSMIIGFLGGLVGIGIISAFGFFLGVLEEWYSAKRKINTDVPELRDAISELRIKLTLMDSAVKRLEGSRRQDAANGRALLDGPHVEVEYPTS